MNVTEALLVEHGGGEELAERRAARATASNSAEARAHRRAQLAQLGALG